MAFLTPEAAGRRAADLEVLEAIKLCVGWMDTADKARAALRAPAAEFEAAVAKAKRERLVKYVNRMKEVVNG